MTKIDIFSGFLGAGKTTLIKKLISEAYTNKKIVLIENEFGEIGIDGGFLEDAGIEITEMNSGCICCSLVGDFSKALVKVIDEFHPDRVLIEPSGVGKLSDVIKAVTDAGLDDAELGYVVTVVDAGKCRMYMKNFGEFFNDQIENAKTIIFSHTDTAKEYKVSEALALVREKNPKAGIATTSWNILHGSELVMVMERGFCLEELTAELRRERHTIKRNYDDVLECDGKSLKRDENDHDHEHHHHEHGEDCKCGCHDHDHEHHHHEHGEDCKCGCHDHDHKHHHHEHGEDCKCGCHDHDHEHHRHEHGEDCKCGCHDHDHEHHHHEHGEDCKCGCHDHDHEHHHHEHGEDCKCGCHGHHHADEVFVSWGVETAKKFTVNEIARCLDELSEEATFGTVLRAKGIVASTEGEWIYFDYVPDEPDVRRGKPGAIGRICVIGSNINEEKLRELFGD